MHEFSHSIVNPLLEEKYNDIARNKVFKELLKTSEFYSSEFSYYAETIIRALQNLYVSDKGSSTAGLDRSSQDCGFDPNVIAAVKDKLDKFRQNPDRDFEKSFVDIANVITQTINLNNENKEN